MTTNLITMGRRCGKSLASREALMEMVNQGERVLWLRPNEKPVILSRGTDGKLRLEPLKNGGK